MRSFPDLSFCSTPAPSPPPPALPEAPPSLSPPPPPPQLRCASFTSIFYLASLLLFQAYMPFVNEEDEAQVRGRRGEEDEAQVRGRRGVSSREAALAVYRLSCNPR